MFKLQLLMVPVDFSEASERALDYAIELARPFGARICVVHVYQLPVYSFPDGVFMPGAEMAVQLSTAAQKSLDALITNKGDAGVALQPLLLEGTPWEEINRVAMEQKADMIVLGTHGRRGFTRALMGSVAETVIRTAVIPVLAIREPHEEP